MDHEKLPDRFARETEERPARPPGCVLKPGAFPPHSPELAWIFRRTFPSLPIVRHPRGVSVDDRKRIAAAIKDYLARERISREEFAFKTRLGKSTVDKLLMGLFSDRTLSIVESHTKLPLRSELENPVPSRQSGPAGPAPATARPALDRGPALRQSERRARAGILGRRDHGGHHHRARAPALALRHRAQLDLRLQGRGDGRPAGRRDLGVRYVLEGSVRAAGPRIRITGQLIDAETGKHIWAEKYDRDLQDVFPVQDDITDASSPRSSRTLRRGGLPRRGPAAGEHRRLGARRPRARPDQQGRAHGRTRRPGAVRPAIALEPSYARAHALLALGDLVGRALLLVPDTREGYREAARMRRNALPWIRAIPGRGWSRGSA